MKKFIILISSLSFPSLSLAHAGDHSANQINHFFSDLFHLIPILGIIAIASYFLAKNRKTEKND